MSNRWRGVLSRHPRVLGGLFAAYWLAIFCLTHMKMPKVEAAPQNTDKAVHLVLYAGFAFLLASWICALKPQTPKLVWWVMGAALVYAALDEILQIPLESRSADVWDFAMDGLGALLGLLLFQAIRRKFPGLWSANESSA